MPVPVSMITLTQVVSGTSTVVARAAIGREIPDLKHLALTVDGTTAKVYFRGRLLMVGTLSTTMTIDRVELQGGTKDTLLSEMLLMPRVAEPEDIKTWWNLRAPFYDPSPVIQEDQIPAAETWNKAVHDAQRALADAADAQATADGKVTTFYQDTEPIAEALGDLWVHTGEDNKLYRWSGSSWDVVQDKKIQEAVQKAEDAQATADGKIVTFYQSTPPTATAVGDLWVDTDDNNHLYRWDGTEWVDIQDKSPIPDERIPSAESWSKKNRTYYQDTPPTGTHSLGDVWFDTSDHNRRHWWDGSKWVDAEDVSPIDASQRPVTARGLGGDIEMDKDGMRFIRKADNEITLQMDIETGSAYFKGDITGASGTFADGRVAIGDIAGKPWGSGTLPSGTAGIWGEDAGLYLRGYARLLMAGTGMDEDTIDLSGFPNLNEPEILVAPRELVTYSPAPGTLSHIIVDAVKQLDGTYRLKAKTLTKGTTVPWGGRSSTTSSWTFIRPTDSIDGKKGVYTDFFICRPTWWVGSGGFGMYTAKLYMYVTDEFNANGDPINWKQIRSFSRSSSGSGTLNWDTALSHSGPWALRVSGSGGGAVLVDYATTGLSTSGYRTGDTYLDVNGDQITGTDPANTPSGMSLIYMVFDKG
jgi:hypothetical protein